MSCIEMAAAYAFHIAESQVFMDGNKRAGLGAGTAFLTMNGYDLIERDERPYTAIIEVGGATFTVSLLRARSGESQ